MNESLILVISSITVSLTSLVVAILSIWFAQFSKTLSESEEDENRAFFESLNWSSITKESATHLIDQAEKNLSDTITAADQLTKRSINILTVAGTIGGALIGYLASNFKKFDLLFVLACIALFIIVIVAHKCFNVYRLYKIKPLGNKPINMLTNQYINHPSQELVFLYNSIRTIQSSYDFNRRENLKRSSIIGEIYRIIEFGFILLVVTLITGIVFIPLL